MSKISSKLYKLSRMFGKAGSTINDVETLMSGDPEKIVKRAVRKKVNKESHKIAQKINNKLK